MMKRLFTLLCALTLACAAEAKTVEAASPGGNLRLAVDVSDRITYGLWSGEDKILENCTLSLTLADRTLGEKPRLRSVKRSSNYISQIFAPVESLGMEIQTIQSAVAGIRRMDEFFALEEREEPHACR